MLVPTSTTLKPGLQSSNRLLSAASRKPKKKESDQHNRLYLLSILIHTVVQYEYYRAHIDTHWEQTG
jgi:hypothetical protein